MKYTKMMTKEHEETFTLKTERRYDEGFSTSIYTATAPDIIEALKQNPDAAKVARKQSDWLASPEHRREVIEEEARWTLAARRLVACGVDPFRLSVLRSFGVMADAFEREADRLEAGKIRESELATGNQ